MKVEARAEYKQPRNSYAPRQSPEQAKHAEAQRKEALAKNASRPLRRMQGQMEARWQGLKFPSLTAKKVYTRKLDRLTGVNSNGEAI